jgi:hypothetical protein
MTAGDVEPQTATSYATGGGGTVLEHQYGAILLCNLLTGDPTPELGDDAIPVSVRFQASAISPVDDLVVAGRTPDGGKRRVSIGVRRAPALVASEDASARLLISYLRVVTKHWGEVQAGRRRLALVVVSPNSAVQQVRELAGIAGDGRRGGVPCGGAPATTNKPRCPRPASGSFRPSLLLRLFLLVGRCGWAGWCITHLACDVTRRWALARIP